MIKNFDKFLNEANALGEHVNESVSDNLSPNLCAVAVGKDIIIFDLSGDSKVENEGDSYGSIDVQIAASIKEAKSTKAHTVEVQISYNHLESTGHDNWEGKLIFDHKSQKLNDDSCISLCSPILEQEIYWADKSSELKDFTGQLISDLISYKYVKLS